MGASLSVDFPRMGWVGGRVDVGGVVLGPWKILSFCK